MKCHEARKQFLLYYDSEGGAEAQFEIADHLAMCPECKAWFEQQSRDESALAGLLNRGQHDEAMWDRIEQRVTEQAAEPAGTARKKTAVWLLAAVAAAVAAAVFLTVYLRGEDHLSALAAVEHQRYVGGQWQAEMGGDSIEALEDLLRRRAGFAVRCPPSGQGGFRLQGGGVCRLRREVGAHIVGDVGGHPISVFVFRGESLRSFPHLKHHLQDEGDVHRCREGRIQMVASKWHGHVIVVMGEEEYSTLQTILKGYGAHGDHATIRAAPPGQA